MTAYCPNKNVNSDDINKAEVLLKSVGGCIAIEERLFSVFTAVAGCGPAFVYMFIDAISEAAVRFGMDKKTALYAAGQTVLGSASALMQSGEHPYSLVDKVCSPGGATVEGVCALHENGFVNAVLSAVSASYNKATEL